MHKRLTFVAALAVSASLGLSATAQDTPQLDTVVATVNGTDITLGHMIIARARLPEQYQQLPDDVLFTGILEQLVQQTALSDTFEGDLPARVELSLDNERRSLKAGEVIEQVMADPLDEDDVQAAYDAEYGNVEPDKEFDASHILVETEEEANAVKTQLDEGADFAEVAREKSTGPSGPGGGALGWFGKGMMVPAFENAVMEMEPGAVSDPVETQFGWHVIKLNDVRDGEAPELETVREEIELQLRQTRVQTAIEEITAGAEVDTSASEAIDPSVLNNIEWLE
jgi:peptidyl-prolyl cis-trans isomerase C